jgi:Domain of unknown function (DUF5666)
MFGMPVILPPPRLTRLAILTLTGATALSVAACGASNNSKPAPSASPTSSAATPSSPSASANGKSWVSGMIASVSGDAIQVTQQTGSATVDFTPSTKITQVGPGQLTDVTAGSCVVVLPRRQSADTGGTITAQFVRVSPAVDAQCPEPKHPAGAPHSGGPAGHRPVQGTVASVAGNTITVTDAEAGGSTSQTSVTVTDTTKYTKQSATDAQALTQGQCIAARGTKDDSGTLQATAISVQSADSGTCPQPGGRRHQH